MRSHTARTTAFPRDVRQGVIRDDSPGFARPATIPRCAIWIDFRWSFIYVRSRVFMLYRSDNRIRTYSTKNHLVFGLGSSFGEPQDGGWVVRATRPRGYSAKFPLILMCGEVYTCHSPKLRNSCVTRPTSHVISNALLILTRDN